MIAKTATPPGAICHHVSTVRANTVIAVEPASWPRVSDCWSVVARTCGVPTHKEVWGTEVAARKRFERVVVSHECGESL